MGNAPGIRAAARAYLIAALTLFHELGWHPASRARSTSRLGTDLVPRCRCPTRAHLPPGAALLSPAKGDGAPGGVRGGVPLDALSRSSGSAFDRHRCRRTLHGPRRAKGRGKARRALVTGADAPKGGRWRALDLRRGTLRGPAFARELRDLGWYQPRSAGPGL